MVSKFSRGIVPVILAIILVAAVAHVASSSPGGFGGPMGHCGMRGGMRGRGLPFLLLLKSANLTDAQKQQVHKIFDARRASRKSEFQQLKAAREAIAAKFTSTGAMAATDLAGPASTDRPAADSDDERANSGCHRDPQRADPGSARDNLRDQGQARPDSRRDEGSVGARRQRFNTDRVGNSRQTPPLGQGRGRRLRLRPAIASASIRRRLHHRRRLDRTLR